MLREDSNHNSPLQSSLSILEESTTHNSSSFFTTSRYLIRCSLSHSFNCVKRDSIPFTSNPFFTLAINTISSVFRLRALNSSNHSLWINPSVSFIPFLPLLQQLIVPYASSVTHNHFNRNNYLNCQQTTATTKPPSTSYRSSPPPSRGTDPPSPTDSADCRTPSPPPSPSRKSGPRPSPCSVDARWSDTCTG